MPHKSINTECCGGRKKDPANLSWMRIRGSSLGELIPKLDMKEIRQRKQKLEFQAEDIECVKVGAVEGEGEQPLSASWGVSIKWGFLMRRERLFSAVIPAVPER